MSALNPTVNLVRGSWAYDIYCCYVFSFRGVFRDHHKIGVFGQKQSLYPSEEVLDRLMTHFP